MTDIEVLQEALEQKLDRLAEDCHDEIIKGHSRDGSGWAKILSPVIWAWFEREIEPLFSAFQELSLSAPSKEPSLRKRPRKRDIERLWVKWIHVKENSKMSLNDAEGFNGFVLGYELKEREKVSGVEEKCPTMNDCKCEFLIKRCVESPKFKQHIEWLKPCELGWPCGKPDRT